MDAHGEGARLRTDLGMARDEVRTLQGEVARGVEAVRGLEAQVEVLRAEGEALRAEVARAGGAAREEVRTSAHHVAAWWSTLPPAHV